ncbi:MAG: universal stress protein, partial [Pseudolabrys sp.]
MYRHILIATDGSVLAEKGVSHGLSLAKSVGAKVTALIVEAPFNVFDVRESR